MTEPQFKVGDLVRYFNGKGKVVVVYKQNPNLELPEAYWIEFIHKPHHFGLFRLYELAKVS